MTCWNAGITVFCLVCISIKLFIYFLFDLLHICIIMYGRCTKRFFKSRDTEYGWKNYIFFSTFPIVARMRKIPSEQRHDSNSALTLTRLLLAIRFLNSGGWHFPQEGFWLRGHYDAQFRFRQFVLDCSGVQKCVGFARFKAEEGRWHLMFLKELQCRTNTLKLMGSRFCP